MLKRLFTITTIKRLRVWCVAGTFLSATTLAFADGDFHSVDWKRLNLSNEQSSQINHLEQDWNGKYVRLQPQIVEHQHHLLSLLSDPKSDPLEIMSTQQQLAHLKEQLRHEATANYLRKRSLLSADQQHQLEGMMHQLVIDRQQRSTATQLTQQEDKDGGIGDLIHSVKWAIEPH